MSLYSHFESLACDRPINFLSSSLGIGQKKFFFFSFPCCWRACSLINEYYFNQSVEHEKLWGFGFFKVFCPNGAVKKNRAVVMLLFLLFRFKLLCVTLCPPILHVVQLKKSPSKFRLSGYIFFSSWIRKGGKEREEYPLSAFSGIYLRSSDSLRGKWPPGVVHSNEGGNRGQGRKEGWAKQGGKHGRGNN